MDAAFPSLQTRASHRPPLSPRATLADTVRFAGLNNSRIIPAVISAFTDSLCAKFAPVRSEPSDFGKLAVLQRAAACERPGRGSLPFLDFPPVLAAFAVAPRISLRTIVLLPRDSFRFCQRLRNLVVWIKSGAQRTPIFIISSFLLIYLNAHNVSA